MNRTLGLRDYLERGDHKVILLSATPQNLGPRDIYRQIRLFLDEVDHGLPLEPQGWRITSAAWSSGRNIARRLTPTR